MPTRSEVIAAARAFLGTPYCHQAATRGAGCDCVGLVRGVLLGLTGRDPGPAPGYHRDWAEASGAETLIAAARLHLVEIGVANARPGDVLLFRFRPRRPAKHAAILAHGPDDAPTLVHALERIGVVEVPLTPWWQRRIAAAFALPGVTD